MLFEWSYWLPQLSCPAMQEALDLTLGDEWSLFPSKFYLLGARGKLYVLFLNETFHFPAWLQPLTKR